MFTPSNIIKLKENEVFVFGANEEGRHGLGAAKTALSFGAVYGESEGHFGQTYAIPTRKFIDGSIKTLSISEIKPYVDRFSEYCHLHPELTFLVTSIGTGLAGLTIEEVAPLFKDCFDRENIRLPYGFYEELTKYEA